MGAGVAKAFATKYPKLPYKLGMQLHGHGNIPGIIETIDKTAIVNLPVKPVQKFITSRTQLVTHMQDRIPLQQNAPGWAVKADIELIKRSATIVEKMRIQNNWNLIATVPPGCGNGELEWEKVYSELEKIWNNNYIICYL
jgi:hypothetical protein